jgi:hypothetical protein
MELKFLLPRLESSLSSAENSLKLHVIIERLKRMQATLRKFQNLLGFLTKKSKPQKTMPKQQIISPEGDRSSRAISGDFPLLSKQKEIVQELLQGDGKNDSELYSVDIAWWEAWRRYVGYEEVSFPLDFYWDFFDQDIAGSGRFPVPRTNYLFIRENGS